MPKINRIRLTNDRIARHQCPKGTPQAFLWDADAPGLAVRTTPKGGQAFIFQSRVNGQPVRVTIGAVKSWSISEARERANMLRRQCDQGIDPRKEARHEVERAQAGSLTLGDAWEIYLKDRKPRWSKLHLGDHVKDMREPGKKHKRSKKLTTAGPLWSLRNTPLSDLDEQRLKRWISTETVDRPTVAAGTYRRLKAFINWQAGELGYEGVLDPETLLTKKVSELVPRPGTRDDVLQREQLATWFAAVKRINDPCQAAYLQCLLLLGCRREELRALKWEDVDFQWNTIRLHDKVESHRVIPLPPYVSATLAALPRRNRWAFSSPRVEDKPIYAPTHQHNAALQSAGLPHVSFHGLRRSFSTLSEWVEVPAGIVAQIMGHKPSALSEKHYKRRPLDLLRKWHVGIERWILDEAGIEQPESATAGLRVVK